MTIRRFNGVGIWALILCAVSLAVLPACSTARFKEKADNEVYGIIDAKSPEVPGMPDDFTIEQADGDPLAGDFPVVTDSDAFLGEAAQAELGAEVISLEEALSIAFTNSRTYQNQKELLYLEALRLTLERYEFAPIFSAGGAAEIVSSTTDVEKLSAQAQLAQAIPEWMRAQSGLNSAVSGNFSTAADVLETFGADPNAAAVTILNGIAGLAGSPSSTLNDYADLVEQAFTAAGVNQPHTAVVRDESLDASTSLGFDILLKGGARIAVDLTSDFLRFLTGDSSTTSTSILSGVLTQPLLRGAGSKVVTERLTQSERDVLYQLRDFTRFRKLFAVQVASSYYEVLQNRDRVRNNWLGYEAFQQSAERDRAYFDEGRLTAENLGRSLQAELDAENGWVNSVRAYIDSLDQYKILLGLPMESRIVLDPKELDELIEKGINHPTVEVEDAVRVAQVARLDLYTARDVVADADRKVYVAANSLKADLDFIASASARSKPGDDQWDTLDFTRGTWSAGFIVDLPTDRKAERNAYVTTLIALDRAEREYTLREDEVTLEVRDAWRQLEQAKRNYENRARSLEVNQQRVELNNMLAELGRATTLDQVDARNDLIESQNQLTDALVTHFIARLEFWRDMGILYIKDDGQWEEVTDVS